MNNLNKEILFETIQYGVYHDDEVKALLREIIETGDEELLQEAFPLLAVLGGLATAAFAVEVSDAIGITDNWYDKVVKYADPFHWGINGARAVLNKTGVTDDEGYHFFGRDPEGSLADTIQGLFSDQDAEEVMATAKDMTEEESNDMLKKMTPEKRRETFKKEHGWTDEEINDWESVHVHGEEEAEEEGPGDAAAAEAAVENEDEGGEAEELDTDTDERFVHIRGDEKLVTALQRLLSLEGQGVKLDRSLSELKNMLISGEMGE